MKTPTSTPPNADGFELIVIPSDLKEARRVATVALTLEEKLAGQRHVKELEGKRNAKRKSLFAAQDEIEARRDELIRTVEGRQTYFQVNRDAPFSASFVALSARHSASPNTWPRLWQD